MLSNPGFVVRFAPLLASLALIFSCCYLYDIKPPTPTPALTPTPACAMSFTNPIDGEVFAPGGLVTFSWKAVAKAKLYILSISGPGNNGSSFNYPVSNGTSWPVDMGSIGGDGTYTAAVQSRDADQNILCQTQIHFKLLSPTATVTATPTKKPAKTATTKPKAHKPPVPAPTSTRRPRPTPTPIILK